MRNLATLAILIAGTTVTALHGEKRAFSLFSVVSFPNEECMGSSASNLMGICKTDEECTNSGGSASGNCASGFGICCVHTTDDCSSSLSITNNVSYILNPGFPSSFTSSSKTCSYTVSGGSNICQIRLDFDSAVFQQPTSTTASCSTGGDTVTVTSPTGISPPVFCGTFTGSHMYVETGRESTAATISLAISGTTSFSRKWKIKVSKIECENIMKAPADCMQYFTGTGGRFFSFNKEEQLTRTQYYKVCMRQEVGYCNMQVDETRVDGSPDSFLLGTPTASGKIGATNCPVGYLVIGDAAHCGSLLANDDANTQPGSTYDMEPPFEVAVLVPNAGTIASSTFDLTYRLLPCD